MDATFATVNVLLCSVLLFYMVKHVYGLYGELVAEENNSKFVYKCNKVYKAFKCNCTRFYAVKRYSTYQHIP